MLGLTLSLLQRCVACDGHMEEHEEGCPFFALRSYLNAMTFRLYICPECHDHRVKLNKSDFFECPKCGTMFSASEIGDGSEPVQPLFRIDFGEHTYVRKLPNKGKGEFPDKEVLRTLAVLIRQRIKERAIQ